MQTPNQKYYNCAITLEDGSAHNVDANWLHNAGHDHWQGWTCHAGVDRIWIYADGSVYGSECRHDYLGNINSDWDLLDTPIKCRHQRCSGCTDDLLLIKENTNVVHSNSR